MNDEQLLVHLKEFAEQTEKIAALLDGAGLTGQQPRGIGGDQTWAPCDSVGLGIDEKLEHKITEPTNEKVYDAVRGILNKGDAYVITLEDMTRQLNVHFGVDLEYKKFEIEGIIIDLINNLSDDVDEDLDDESEPLRGVGDSNKDKVYDDLGLSKPPSYFIDPYYIEYYLLQPNCVANYFYGFGCELLEVDLNNLIIGNYGVDVIRIFSGCFPIDHIAKLARFEVKPRCLNECPQTSSEYKRQGAEKTRLWDRGKTVFTLVSRSIMDFGNFSMIEGSCVIVLVPKIGRLVRKMSSYVFFMVMSHTRILRTDLSWVSKPMCFYSKPCFNWICFYRGVYDIYTKHLKLESHDLGPYRPSYGFPELANIFSFFGISDSSSCARINFVPIKTTQKIMKIYEDINDLNMHVWSLEFCGFDKQRVIYEFSKLGVPCCPNWTDSMLPKGMIVFHFKWSQEIKSSCRFVDDWYMHKWFMKSGCFDEQRVSDNFPKFRVQVWPKTTVLLMGIEVELLHNKQGQFVITSRDQVAKTFRNSFELEFSNSDNRGMSSEFLNSSAHTSLSCLAALWLSKMSIVCGKWCRNMVLLDGDIFRTLIEVFQLETLDLGARIISYDSMTRAVLFHSSSWVGQYVLSYPWDRGKFDKGDISCHVRWVAMFTRTECFVILRGTSTCLWLRVYIPLYQSKSCLGVLLLVTLSVFCLGLSFMVASVLTFSGAYYHGLQIQDTILVSYYCVAKNYLILFDHLGSQCHCFVILILGNGLGQAPKVLRYIQWLGWRGILGFPPEHGWDCFRGWRIVFGFPL